MRRCSSAWLSAGCMPTMCETEVLRTSDLRPDCGATRADASGPDSCATSAPARRSHREPPATSPQTWCGRPGAFRASLLVVPAGPHRRHKCWRTRSARPRRQHARGEHCRERRHRFVGAIHVPEKGAGKEFRVFGFSFLSKVTFIRPSSPSLRTVPNRRSPNVLVNARCWSSFILRRARSRHHVLRANHAVRGDGPLRSVSKSHLISLPTRGLRSIACNRHGHYSSPAHRFRCQAKCKSHPPCE